MEETATSKLASRGKRFGGALIDGLIAVVMIVPIMLVTGDLQSEFRGDGMTTSQRLAFFALGQVVFLILNGNLLLNRGQTIGKVVMKTRIVDLDGNIPTFGKLIVLRYLVFASMGLIPILGSLVGFVNPLLIFGKERRCLHDYFAGTRVVDA